MSFTLLLQSGLPGVLHADYVGPSKKLIVRENEFLPTFCFKIALIHNSDLLTKKYPEDSTIITHCRHWHWHADVIFHWVNEMLQSQL